MDGRAGLDVNVELPAAAAFQIDAAGHVIGDRAPSQSIDALSFSWFDLDEQMVGTAPLAPAVTPQTTRLIEAPANLIRGCVTVGSAGLLRGAAACFQRYQPNDGLHRCRGRPRHSPARRPVRERKKSPVDGAAKPQIEVVHRPSF